MHANIVSSRAFNRRGFIIDNKTLICYIVYMNKDFNNLSAYQKQEFINGTKFAKSVIPYIKSKNDVIKYTKLKLNTCTLEDDKIYYEGILYILENL